MSFIYGSNLKISVFGSSHGKYIGSSIDGIPSGIKIDFKKIDLDLKRRRGINNISTNRREQDEYEFISGIKNGVTTGAIITVIVSNTDIDSSSYNKDIVRPSHADYTKKIKYQGYEEYEGGGISSGRMTVGINIIGSICTSILKDKGIDIYSHITSINDLKDDSEGEIDDIMFPCFNKNIKDKMINKIEKARSEGDSLGGVIRTFIKGVPAGVGDPFFNSIESNISSLIFSIPGVKGIDFGLGFDFNNVYGSSSIDEFYYENGDIKTYTNNNGGINGGISNGMPIMFKTVIKPTPTIKKVVRTINTKTLENIEIEFKGRHDPCIVPRVIPVIEGVSSFAILDLLYKRSIIK